MTDGIEDSVALVIFFLFHLRKLPYIFVNSHVPGMHQISPLLGRFHAPLVSGLPTGRDVHCSVYCCPHDYHYAGRYLHPLARIIALNFLRFLLVVAVPEEQL